MRKPTAKTLLAVATLAAATAAVPATASAGAVRYGHTPSGNITCKAQNYGGPGWNLTCSIRSERRTLKISTAGRAYEVGYRPVALRGKTMRYDSGTIKLGSFSCDSFRSGLSCLAVAPAGDGQIFMSRAKVRYWN